VNKQTSQVSVAQLRLPAFKEPAVTSVIIGAKKNDQLLDNVASVHYNHPDDCNNWHYSTLPPEYPGWMVERQLQGSSLHNTSWINSINPDYFLTVIAISAMISKNSYLKETLNKNFYLPLYNRT